MRNSKVFSVLLICLVLTSFLMSNVAAQGAAQKFGDAIKGIIDGIKAGGNPIFSALFGTSAGTQELFIQILAFLLVMFVVYGVLSMTNIFGEDRGWLNVVIGAIIAIIGIRFIPAGFLKQMAIPSSAFVALIVLGMPFIILFFLVSSLPSLVRRAIWTVYGVLILVMWVYNYDNKFWYVYWVIIAACIVAFWFDGVVGRFFRRAKSEKIVGKQKDLEERKLQQEIISQTKLIAGTTDTTTRHKFEAELQRKKDALKALQKMKI